MANPAGPPTNLDLLNVSGVPTMGMAGVPSIFTGNWYFVNETTGSDGNPGTANAPLKTLSQAHTLATANQNDVVAFQGTIHQTASLAWSKNQVHLIGMCAPLKRGKRARISVSGTTAFTPLLDVTASGCYFGNFGTFYGFDSATNNVMCLSAAGQRNCYANVEILGFGDGTATTGTANKTTSRAAVVGGAGGAGENTFLNCVFGVDTEARNATNYTLEFLSGSGTPRNYFIGCDFEALLGSSGGSACHIYVAASGSIDRYAKFERCTFNNAVNSTGTTMTACALIAASAGGYITMVDCEAVGITDWEATPSNLLYHNMVVPTASLAGIMINNT